MFVQGRLGKALPLPVEDHDHQHHRDQRWRIADDGQHVAAAGCRLSPLLAGSRRRLALHSSGSVSFAGSQDTFELTETAAPLVAGAADVADVDVAADECSAGSWMAPSSAASTAAAVRLASLCLTFAGVAAAVAGG